MSTKSRSDVIKEILHFLDANGFKNSLKCLQLESGVPHNVLHATNDARSKRQFEKSVLAGDWPTVLNTYLDGVLLPKEVKVSLYSLIVEETVRVHGLPDAADALLENSPVLSELQKTAPVRFSKLKQLIQSFDAVALEEERRTTQFIATTEKARHELLSLLLPLLQFSDVPYNNVLPMALGALDIGSPDTRKRPREDTQRAAIEDAWSKTTLACPLKCPESIAKKIQFGEGSYITLCRSVPVEKERSVLVVCQESGITDFLDPTTFTVVGKSVRHASSTLSMDCDTPLEATESAWIGLGYRDGWVKVYDADSHKLVRKFEKVHELGVSTVVFVGNKRADALQGHSPFLLSGSFDTTMCLLDISSGASLFQVKDAHHSSFINSICVLPFRIGVYTLSSGNDGSLAFWSLGKADSPAVERCGNVIPLQRVSPDCGDGVASSLSLLPSTSSAPSRCELVVATNVDKVLLCGVEMGLGESGEAAFDVVPFAILQCGKPIVSVSYEVPNANFVSFYVCDCEGLLYLYSMELDSERQKDSKVSVMSPVDVSSLLVIEHGDNVKEARADVVYPHSGNPMLSIYSAFFPELYLVQ